MVKITKKEYEQHKQLLSNRINELKQEQKKIEEMFNNDDYSLGERWNDAEDKVNDLQRELKYLDDEWDTRNWTQQDWNEWELVKNNID